jgi:general secretion pathway protein E
MFDDLVTAFTKAFDKKKPAPAVKSVKASAPAGKAVRSVQAQKTSSAQPAPTRLPDSSVAPAPSLVEAETSLTIDDVAVSNVEPPSSQGADIVALDSVTEDVADAETSGRIVFSGILLTATGGPMKIVEESRNLCALFDTGLWLVSASHKNSPLVTSVAAGARRQGYKVNAPRYVTPDVIRQAYHTAERKVASIRLDDNAIRRKIVETLKKAHELGANDIHIEAGGGRTKVDFRIDGALRLWETWTQREGEQFLSAVFSHASVQSGATANWMEPQAAMLVPQNGPDSIRFPDGIISVRCQWMPLADGGRYLDMRLQYDAVHIFGEGFIASDVDSLGFTQEQTALIRRLRSIPGGMRIITGPVNQGKTTTLRVMLNRRMAETNMQLNCIMIEDPPEGGVIGARQIGVSGNARDEQRERVFTEVMRSCLRLDPDIVMLGETRDLQSANFLFRLSLTGRQVYTTLHVYSAIAVPQRLRDLGIEPYLVYDSHLVRGMMCQRLLRALCKHCRIPLRDAVEADPELLSLARRLRAGIALMDAERRTEDALVGIEANLQAPDLRDVYLANQEGCPHCYKGRSGRTVAAEVIETDARLMDLLRENRQEEARAYWLAPNGLAGLTMLWHSLEKVRRGDVTPEDVEFEFGPLASDREIATVEKSLGYFEQW